MPGELFHFQNLKQCKICAGAKDLQKDRAWIRAMEILLRDAKRLFFTGNVEK